MGKSPVFLPSWSLTGKRGRKEQQDHDSLSPQDHETAHLLFMLSCSSPSHSSTRPSPTSSSTTTTTTTSEPHTHSRPYTTASSCIKEYNESTGTMKLQHLCTKCGKGFASHQALGGHRASHRRVKGCFASEEERESPVQNAQEKDSEKHRCSVCFKLFASGQALGGHKRCHWDRNRVREREGGFESEGREREDGFEMEGEGRERVGEFEMEGEGRERGSGFFLDLNQPPPIEDLQDCFS
ncbi:hypothetical protein AMTRI_Chr08g208270 [Amborella trichopoda]